jgi:hypothetical protein
MQIPCPVGGTEQVDLKQAGMKTWMLGRTWFNIPVFCNFLCRDGWHNDSFPTQTFY